MQEKILYRIDKESYMNFLQSEMYLGYLNRHHMSINNSSSSGSEEHSNYISRSSTLPTLNENSELLTCGPSFGSQGGYKASGSMALTRDALLATEHRRLEIHPSR